MPFASTITSRSFGSLPNGESVELYALANASGTRVEVMNYGGIVTSLRLIDRHGRLRDVVLGFDSLARYLVEHPCFGAIVGRVAGRITGGRFTLEGHLYELACNDGSNHLHGGRTGFDKRLWTGEPLARSDGAASLRLSYRSPDGEEGYPGTVDVAVIYTLTAENVFMVETEAVSDRPTPLCLTHHSYFNLSGEGEGSVAGHELKIHADEYVPIDGTMTLLGRRVAVSGRSNDFNVPRCLGEAIPGLFRRHGDLYFIRRSSQPSAAPVIAARLIERSAGLGLEVRTTEPCLQLYTGSALNSTLSGKSGRPYGPHAGLCLECQGYPDGVNAPEMSDIILRPGTVRRGRTEYAFFTL